MEGASAAFLKIPQLLFKDSQLATVKDASWELDDSGLQFHAKSTDVNFSVLPIISFAGEIDTSRITQPLKHYGVTAQVVDAYTETVNPVTGYGLRHRQNCINALNSAYAKLLTKCQRRKPVVVLVILANKDRKLYPEIKFWGDCQKGLTTICLTRQKFDKDWDKNAPNVW